MMNKIVNVFDFNFVSSIGHNFPITDRKGVTNAFRTNHFLSTHEVFPKTRIQQMCSPVSRRTTDSDLFLFRSISLHGLRSTDLSGVKRQRKHGGLPTLQQAIVNRQVVLLKALYTSISFWFNPQCGWAKQRLSRRGNCLIFKS